MMKIELLDFVFLYYELEILPSVVQLNTLSLFLLSFLLLFLQVYLMNLYHRFFVFLIVVRSDRSRRTDQIHNLTKLSHLRPLSSVKSVIVSQVYVCPLRQKELDNLLKTEPRSIMKRSEPSLIAKSGVCGIVEQKTGNFVVVLFDCIVQWCLLPNIVVLLSGKHDTLM